MAYNNPYDRMYREAQRRVRARTGFYIHLSVYIAVNAFLVAIYLVTSWQINDFLYPWFLWPLGLWGIGLVANAAGVFLRGGDVQQRMLDRELRRMGVPNPLVPPTSPAINGQRPASQVPTSEIRDVVGTPR